jgi:hypothetical protein
MTRWRLHSTDATDEGEAMTAATTERLGPTVGTRVEDADGDRPVNRGGFLSWCPSALEAGDEVIR